MAVSKIAYDGHTLIDLTGDTAVEADVASGKTFHKADGTQAVGTASGGGGTVNRQNKTVNLGSSAPSSVSADSGYDGLGQVSFNVSGISASKIKNGESICGVSGTYKGTASFSRQFTLTYRFTGSVDDPLVKHLYYRGADSTNPSNVVWKDIGLNADGAQYSETLYLCPMLSDDPDDYVNAIIDGFFIEGTDGSLASDITVLAGDASCAYVAMSSSGQTGSQHFYIITHGSSATIEIDLPN